MEQPLGRIIIITGLSGSGKSTALNTLEDNGFFCIDNLPVQLLTKFLALWHESNTEVIKLGVVMDLREKDFVRRFQDVFQQMQSYEYDLTVIFLEASDGVLVKRFSETRRRHPLVEREIGILEAIRLERNLMAPVREIANEVIDTSTLNTPKLREIFSDRFARTTLGQRLSIELLSFGFKHGIPPQTDILMDVRFLPNPYYLDDLRSLDGRDPRIVEYVMSSEDAVKFVKKFTELLDFVIPLYQREGKSYLAIAVGCTGGQHRSVTVVNELAANLKKKFDRIAVRHRDIPKQETYPIMIGFVVVTHGSLGAELINTAEFILGRIEHCSVVSIDGQRAPEAMRSEIEHAIKNADKGQGVLVLTDMFGGTPSNLSLSFLSEGKVEVLTGVNLPMIIKLVQSRDKMSLAELAESIGAYGRKSINVAGQILHKRVKG